jgi:hypothetical protein
MPNGRKPGRPKDPILEIVRSVHRDRSPRTQARFARALKMASATGIPDEIVQQLIVECSRSYGGFNFAGFERRVEEIAAMRRVVAGER